MFYKPTIINSQITQIVESKYPLDLSNLIDKLDINTCRFFTDEVGNYVLIDKEDNSITVTFFQGTLSYKDAYDEKNGGVFLFLKI